IVPDESSFRSRGDRSKLHRFEKVRPVPGSLHHDLSFLLILEETGTILREIDGDWKRLLLLLVLVDDVARELARLLRALGVLQSEFNDEVLSLPFPVGKDGHPDR